MLVMLEAVAMPPDADGAREVRHYAYTSEADDPANLGGTVRDANNALDVVRRLVGRAEEREISGWYEGEPPGSPDVQPLWSIAIRIFASRPRVSRYQVTYCRRNGCPLRCTHVMMATYHAVKRAFKNGRRALEAERLARRRSP